MGLEQDGRRRRRWRGYRVMRRYRNSGREGYDGRKGEVGGRRDSEACRPLTEEELVDDDDDVDRNEGDYGRRSQFCRWKVGIK